MDIIPHPGFKCYTGIFHLHRIETVQEVFKRPALDQKTVPILKGNPCRRIVFCQASNLFLSKSKVFGCFLGACAGQYLQFDTRGIEFSATAFFLVVVVNQWRQYRSKLPFLTALVSATGFYLLLGKEHFLIPTLMTCVAALILLRRPIEAKEETQDE